MATSYYQDPFGAADYSAEGMPSLLSLSNLESLGRGSFAGLLGLPEDLRKMLVTKKMQENMDFLSSQSGVPQIPYFLPSSEELKQRTPRMTTPTPQAGLLEDVGAFMSPVPAAAVGPLARGGKALGKAYLKEIDAAMMGERGGLLGAITPQPKFLDVYHGTPHRLPPTERNPLGEFDASKIGTGEGAQAYGYGIYTAEAPAVAEGYMNTLAGNVNAKSSGYYPKVNGKVVYDDFEDIDIVRKIAAATEPKVGGIMGLGKRQAISSDEAIAELIAKNKLIADDPVYYSEARAKALDEIQGLQKYLGKKIEPSKPSLYKVNLPDEKIATMLDWDAPLSQQPKNIQNWLKDSMNPYRKQLAAKDVGGNEPTGSLIYNRLAALMSEGKKSDVFTNAANYGAKNASQELADAGIAGIKYLDEASRAAGKGTRNFVTFPGEEKSMTILERNGKTGLLD
tara:strand:- start:32 stop:1387 length:1356 start_codon:yes stop_codon:yes gene_type:complete